MHKSGMLSIWFFAGGLLLVFGTLIFFTAVYQYFFPPEIKPVLFELHPGLWWGALMMVLGAIYTVKFRPGRTRR